MLPIDQPTRRHPRINADAGFTLVELLVVILIIGILAAIAIPSFIGQRDKAGDVQAKAAVREAQTAQAGLFSTNQKYGSKEDLVQSEPSFTEFGDRLVVRDVSENGYTVEVTAKETGNVFRVTRTDTTNVRSCTAVDPGRPGGCTDGTW